MKGLPGGAMPPGWQGGLITPPTMFVVKAIQATNSETNKTNHYSPTNICCSNQIVVNQKYQDHNLSEQQYQKQIYNPKGNKEGTIKMKLI